jgi:hypothetical protein
MYEHDRPGWKWKKACPLSAGMLVPLNQVGKGKENSANYRDKQGVERTRPLGLVA